MALISARTIITSISLFHLTLAYFFVFNPSTVDDQALVWILGESMGMPNVRGFDSTSPALAFLAVVLALFGLGDLVSLSMPDEVVLLYHWGTQAPLRFVFSLGMVFYTYMFGPSSPIYGVPPRSGRTSQFNPSSGSPTDALKNRIIFTFLFVEMVSWFWVWVTLREEREPLILKAREEAEARRR
ncbi:increased loss of mitochondrial DNA protein 1 [Stachybotrys elegans]|uniref:Increased loss of mitochondrial DNA protein 1 n=1 Tax=Stachybotrys elegans TaxID=80388 RepID=A0A8K0WNU7_9HYPO|nr:increased loss of mitochondrial DNA protein 1 [Stachybotrys elegans]